MTLLIAGYGARGRAWAATAARRRGHRVVGVVDPDPAARAQAEATGLAAHETLEAGLGAGADACVIASPPEAHVDQALAALDAGLAVLVEKPVSLDVGGAARIADRAARAGLPALAAMNFRLRPVERAIRLGLARIGPPRASLIRSSRPATPGRDAGAGVLWDFGIHHLDLLVDRAGELPATVAGELDGHVHRLRLTWESGAFAEWLHDEGAGLFHTYQWVEGPAGAVSADAERVVQVTTSRRPRRIRVPRGASPEAELLDRLARVRATGGPDAFDVRNAIRTVAVVQAANHAIGGRVALPHDLLAGAA
jgi:predicted dehydrogenase